MSPTITNTNKLLRVAPLIVDNKKHFVNNFFGPKVRAKRKIEKWMVLLFLLVTDNLKIFWSILQTERFLEERNDPYGNDLVYPQNA